MQLKSKRRKNESRYLRKQSELNAFPMKEKRVRKVLSGGLCVKAKLSRQPNSNLANGTEDLHRQQA
jgi:hypothetical protein